MCVGVVFVSSPAWPAPPDWLQSVQALMVLTVVFSSVSFLVFLGQLFTMSTGGLFYFTGLCQICAGSHLQLSSSSYQEHTLLFSCVDLGKMVVI